MKRRNVRVRLLFVLLAGAIASILASTSRAVPDTEARRPLVLVAGDTLTIADLDVEIGASLAAGQEPSQVPEIDPDAALKRLIQNRLLEQEGYRIGADGAKAVQLQVQELIRARSVKALMDSVSAPQPGSDPGAPDSLLGRTGTMRRYSHILVPDRELARTLRDSVSAGVPFADLARRHSTDANAVKGGDLGWAAENAYVEEFEAAARKLVADEVAGPVETKFGWHLVTLTDTRTDTLRSESMAKAVTAARERQRRMDAIRKYIALLRTKYGVTVNDSLLAGLDYASKDPVVQKQLESGDAVLAVLPTGRLTVSGLTRRIRFQYFHGLADHPDAAGVRDKMFDEWVTEALLTNEAVVLGLDRVPGLVREAKREERRLMREEVLKGVLGFAFKPSDAEVLAYYAEHGDELTPQPRVKVRSVLITTEEVARRFRQQLDAGTAFQWLVERTPEINDGPPPIPTDWIDPEKLEMEGKPLAEGVAIGPLTLSNGWAVGRITVVEKVEAPPLDTCRDTILRMMRGVRNRQAIEDAIATLEAGTPITVVDGARAAVADRIGQWRIATAARSQP